jgi:hypothetical protein
MLRLYTENTGKIRRAVKQSELVRKSGATVFFAVGYWKGKKEKSVIVEATDEGLLRGLAQNILKLGQDAVLLIGENGIGELIES